MQISTPAKMGKKYDTLSSKEIYKNPWIRVREDNFVQPDGQVGIYGVVEMKKGLGVLPVDENGQIYLLKQYRYPVESFSWEAVNGAVEDGESVEDTAVRELREEAGLKADKLKLLDVFWPSCGLTTEEAYIFLATDLKEIQKSPEGSEEFEIKRFTLQEAMKMVEEGKIMDSYTLVGLLRIKDRHNSSK